MRCPKCSHPMERVDFQGVEVDRCTVCKGLWFDALEHELLKKMEGSEEIDSGDPDVGELFDKEQRVDLPGLPRAHDSHGGPGPAPYSLRVLYGLLRCVF